LPGDGGLDAILVVAFHDAVYAGGRIQAAHVVLLGAEDGQRIDEVAAFFLIILIEESGGELASVGAIFQIQLHKLKIGIDAGQDGPGTQTGDMSKFRVGAQSVLIGAVNWQGDGCPDHGGGPAAEQSDIAVERIGRHIFDVAKLVSVDGQGEAQDHLVDHGQGGIRHRPEAGRERHDLVFLEVGGKELKTGRGGDIGISADHQSRIAQLRIELHIVVLFHDQSVADREVRKAAKMHIDRVSPVGELDVVKLVQHVFPVVPVRHPQAIVLVKEEIQIQPDPDLPELKLLD